MPYIAPDDYASTPVYNLLEAAATGFIGFDQRLIHALVDDPARSVPDLVRFTAEKNFHPELNADFIAIFRRLGSPEAAPFYVQAIRESLDDVPDLLIEAVTALGGTMTDPLLALYEEVGEEQGGEVAFMLAGLGVRDQRILDLLLERLDYDAGDGAISLGLYGDPAAIPHIRKIVDEIGGGDPYFRHELQAVIEQLMAEAPAELTEPEPFDIFELYPDEAGPLFEVLSWDERLSLLAAAPPEIRAGAAESFRDEEYPGSIRARLLEAAKTDPDANVRGRAWEALGQYSDDPEISKPLYAAAATAPLDERTGAVVGLASGSEVDEEAMPLIEALYDEPEARAKTLEAMWKSLDRRFQSYMVAHLDDADVLVRHHAIYGVGYLGVGSEAGRLVALFHDDDFRHDALLAYALAVPAEITRSRIKPLFRRIEQLAGDLSFEEAELVKGALDQRLQLHGHRPVFGAGEEAQPEAEPAAPDVPKVGRNDPCPCGSGKKYKKCHGG